MAMKAKHAFGSEAKIPEALVAGKIDAYDILFLDEKKVGWVTKDGEVVIAEPDLSGVEAELAKKASAEEVATLEAEMANKVEAKEVEAKIGQAVTDTVASAKAYTDGKIEAAINEHMVKKYEITSTPEGTLVDYREKEIRVMCPADAVFAKQAVGTGGDPNSYYVTFKTFVYNDDVVGYMEHINGASDTEVLTDLKTDEYGRRYQPTWLSVANYDEATGVWNYRGKDSSREKYIGWDYQIDWYNADGVMIASDCIRINLSNEDCHFLVEPYYVAQITKEIDEKIEEKILEVEASYEVIEF